MSEWTRKVTATEVVELKGRETSVLLVPRFHSLDDTVGLPHVSLLVIFMDLFPRPSFTAQRGLRLDTLAEIVEERFKLNATDSAALARAIKTELESLPEPSMSLRAR